MQFTALPLLALAASASAMNAGWNVTRSYRDVSQQVVGFDLTAVFVSDEYPKGLESKCSWTEKGQVYGLSCSPDSFSLEPASDGYTMKLQQVIEKPTKQTVYGEGKVPREGHVVIDVNARVA